MAEILHQLRLVVYLIIYRASYIPGGARFQPSTVGSPKKVEESSGNMASAILGGSGKSHESETKRPFVKHKKLRTKNKMNQTI